MQAEGRIREQGAVVAFAQPGTTAQESRAAGDLLYRSAHRSVEPALPRGNSYGGGRAGFAKLRASPRQRYSKAGPSRSGLHYGGHGLLQGSERSSWSSRRRSPAAASGGAAERGGA